MASNPRQPPVLPRATRLAVHSAGGAAKRRRHRISPRRGDRPRVSTAARGRAQDARLGRRTSEGPTASANPACANRIFDRRAICCNIGSPVSRPILMTTTVPSGDSGGEQRFRLVVEAAPNAMVLIDRAGAIALTNTHAERLFGYSRAEMVGQPVEM